MPLQVISGAIMACTHGTAPARLTVQPGAGGLTGGAPPACITDHRPRVNIPPFGLCISLANPAVAAATAAAQGVLTPQRCVPATSTPWTPGSPTVGIGHIPALNSRSRCHCLWLGVISITYPGQTTCIIP
ncbi:DUF4280 domain-containing protein [Niveispirillum fermenti]|uniref:DUF4280 domain-containing protein n=1 Tax=Niveispirillum fermenti TaxID=1233113 RepID=UPI003A874342